MIYSRNRCLFTLPFLRSRHFIIVGHARFELEIRAETNEGRRAKYRDRSLSFPRLEPPRFGDVGQTATLGFQREHLASTANVSNRVT